MPNLTDFLEQHGHVVPASQNSINLDTAMNVMSQNLNSQDAPRVGIFWYDTRHIKVGSWINTHPEAKDLIREEFNLDNEKYQFEIDQHWEIGFGWEGW
jgi:hypothetical protein